MGLWLRGAVWQFRTHLPADLQAVLGRTHINRSLRTSSHPDAIRAGHDPIPAGSRGRGCRASRCHGSAS
ncbi:DUF6538 domain-containing protein [Azospirillum oleiclasticum]|uniref:DUF6538 domain-containing protein n=1 Tax=Azospirillum oleiclasticum TaxID=2735135 RepID=UPI003CCD5085